jgi:hypothetical protein
LHPHADPPLSSLASDPKVRERADEPPLEQADESAHIATEALPDVEHHVDDPLSGSMVGELAAASRPMHGKAIEVE